MLWNYAHLCTWKVIAQKRKMVAFLACMKENRVDINTRSHTTTIQHYLFSLHRHLLEESRKVGCIHTDSDASLEHFAHEDAVKKYSHFCSMSESVRMCMYIHNVCIKVYYDIVDKYVCMYVCMYEGRHFV